MNIKTINIGKDFSDTPLGRYPSDSDYSGERFRNEILLPALNDSDRVSVEIGDVEGYGSSFLEEAFGGLVRKCHMTAEVLKNKLLIECKNPGYSIYERLIWKYIKEAKAE